MQGCVKRALCFCSCSFCLQHLGYKWEVRLHEAAETVCVASSIAPSCSGDQEALCRILLLLRREVRLELPAPQPLQAGLTHPRAACCSGGHRKLLRAWCCTRCLPAPSLASANLGCLCVGLLATVLCYSCVPNWSHCFTLCVCGVSATVGPPAALPQPQIINSNIDAIR